MIMSNPTENINIQIETMKKQPNEHYKVKNYKNKKATRLSQQLIQIGRRISKLEDISIEIMQLEEKKE